MAARKKVEPEAATETETVAEPVYGSTFASRLAARKAVQDGENKAVKGSETK